MTRPLGRSDSPRIPLLNLLPPALSHRRTPGGNAGRKSRGRRRGRGGNGRGITRGRASTRRAVASRRRWVDRLLAVTSPGRERLAEVAREALVAAYVPPAFEIRPSPEHPPVDPEGDATPHRLAAPLLCARLIREKGGSVSELGALLDPMTRREVEARLYRVGLGLALEGAKWAVFLHAPGG